MHISAHFIWPVFQNLHCYSSHFHKPGKMHSKLLTFLRLGYHIVSVTRNSIFLELCVIVTVLMSGFSLDIYIIHLSSL